MRFVRGTFTIVAVAGMSILAGGAWFGMLAAERDAESTATAGSRRAAAAAAVAISQAVSTGNRPEALIPLLEATGDTKVLVRDRDGTILGGSASPSKQSVTVLVPGTDWSVAVAVPRAQGLGLHRFVNVFAGISVLVLASALFAMYLLVRDRHRAAIALADANRRFRDLVAADELTGLGNQARLVDELRPDRLRRRRPHGQ
ncbi:MAG: hypothetical protein JF603_06515 [Acidobacteria bacterium]|nr:hypothetical protein [Acidobacteriota bacterium]